MNLFEGEGQCQGHQMQNFKTWKNWIFHMFLNNNYMSK